MANGLHTIDQTIQDVRKSITQRPGGVQTAGAGGTEAAEDKVLLNFLDGLSGQIRAFCFTWTGAETFDKPKKP